MVTLRWLPSAVAVGVARTIGRGLEHSVAAEARSIGLRQPASDGAPVTDDDLAPLPEPAQRFLRWAGVVGRPRDRSFRARLEGRFRRGRDDPWMRCEAWQYNVAQPVTRLFHMRIDVAGFFPMVGRDVYIDGHGGMHGRVLGIVPVAEGTGEPFDIGELTTFLNDAVVLAPSMLLDERTTWTAIDDGSFGIAFTDAGRTVSATVFVDADGALTDYHTTDRFFDGPDGPVRATWTTPIDGWERVGEGRRVPTRAQAIWQLDDGPLPYVDGRFSPDAVAWNVGP